jgi:hypothetical protein
MFDFRKLWCSAEKIFFFGDEMEFSWTVDEAVFLFLWKIFFWR